MSFLEKKIKENKDFFDDRQIPEGHKARFSDKLDRLSHKKVRKDRWPAVFRIAAVIAILVSGFFVLRNFSYDNVSGAVLNQVTEISFGTEIENVFAYYDAISEKKIEKIDQLAPNNEEAGRIKKFAEKQLRELDANLAEIEKEYTKYPDNKRLKAAMVNNKRKKAEIMDNILKQLDEANAAMPPEMAKEKINTNP